MVIQKSASDYVGPFEENRYVVVENALPNDVIQHWKETAVELLARFTIDIHRTTETHRLSYRVITGEIIQEHFAALYSFYTSASTREWIRVVTQEAAILTSPHLRSSININSLERPEHVYRWHFDAMPYTLLLYLTTHDNTEGGALEIYPNLKNPGFEQEPDLSGKSKITIPPKAGTLILMDGTTTYHFVAPVNRNTLRLSVPMVYPTTIDKKRPAALDDYLYQPSSS